MKIFTALFIIAFAVILVEGRKLGKLSEFGGLGPQVGGEPGRFGGFGHDGHHGGHAPHGCHQHSPSSSTEAATDSSTISYKTLLKKILG